MLRRFFVQLMLGTPAAVALSPRLPAGIGPEDVRILDAEEVLPPLPVVPHPPKLAARQLIVTTSHGGIMRNAYGEPRLQERYGARSRMFSKDWVFKDGVFQNRTALVWAGNGYGVSSLPENGTIVVIDANAPWVCVELPHTAASLVPIPGGESLGYETTTLRGQVKHAPQWLQIKIEPESMPTKDKADIHMPRSIARDRERHGPGTEYHRTHSVEFLRRVYGDDAVNAWLDKK